MNMTLQQFFDRCEDFGIVVSNLAPSVAQLAESKQSELDNIRAVFEQGRKYGTLIYADEETFDMRAFVSFLKYVGYQREPAIHIAACLRIGPHPEAFRVFDHDIAEPGSPNPALCLNAIGGSQE